MESENHIASAEYETWLTPRQVLDQLPTSWSWETSCRTIANNLRDGLICAVAEVIVIGEVHSKFFKLPGRSWEGWACLADPDFWTAGTRQHYADGAGSRYRADFAFRAHRVRLDPSGVSKLLGMPDSQRASIDDYAASKGVTVIGMTSRRRASKSEPPKEGTLYSDLFPATDPQVVEELRTRVADLETRLHSVSHPPKPPAATLIQEPPSTPMVNVTDSQLRSWFDALPTESQALGIRAIWAAAKSAHPGRRVYRKQVETFVEGRKRGRPSKPKNVPGNVPN